MDVSRWCGSAEDSDVNIAVDDEKIPAHKIVLKSQCGYFMTLFRSEVGKIHHDSPRITIDLSDYSTKTVHLCLRHLYGDWRRFGELSADEWCELFSLANFLVADNLIEDMEGSYRIIVPVTDLINLAMSTGRTGIMDIAVVKVLEMLSGTHTEILADHDILCGVDLAAYKCFRASWLETFPNENYHLFHMDCEYCEKNSCDIAIFIGDIAFHEIRRDDLLEIHKKKIISESKILSHLIASMVIMAST